MNKLFAKFLMLVFFTVSFGAYNVNAMASTLEAQQFIEKISNSVLEIITSNANASQKEKKLSDLFVKSVDTKWMAHFVMGKYWNEASEAQRKKYVEVHKKFLISSYVPKFREYNNQQIKVTKASDEGDGEYLVETKIVSSDGKEVNVSYKVRKGDGGKYAVFDVIAEGVSLITTQRSDFASVLSREGIDGLIQKLGAKG